MSFRIPLRFFRFRLRTIFIITTLLACWLGWQAYIVNERLDLLQELRQNPAIHLVTEGDWAQRFPAGKPVVDDVSVSWHRRLLGDVAIKELWYSPHIREVTEEDRERMARVFPEAEIREAHSEPCHPGCFPAGTFVETPTGTRAVESFVVGDAVSIVLTSGEIETAYVQSIFMTDNRLWQIDTVVGTLLTTETQPLCLSLISHVSAGKMRLPTSILCFHEGQVQAVKVLQVSPTDRMERVYNLVLGNSEVFIAGGFLARSKPPADLAQR